jgi:hypothetical protein
MQTENIGKDALALLCAMGENVEDSNLLLHTVEKLLQQASDYSNLSC